MKKYKNILFVTSVIFLTSFLIAAAPKKDTSVSNSKTIEHIKPDIIVAQDGSGNVKTLNEAAAAIPANNTKWFVIYIKKGIYKEVSVIPSDKTFVHLIGEDAKSTILTFDNYNLKSGGTEKSSSTFLKGNDIIAEDITFENNYDYYKSKDPNEQAVALVSTGDRHIFKNCRFLGYQDTLFLKTGRKYFYNCYIAGIIDFIFGDATSVFNECEIHLYEKSEFISAPSTLQRTQYGFVFIKCKITGDPKVKKDTVCLGRPWHPSSFKEPVKSSAVYLFCDLSAHIKAKGWADMGSTQPKTERFFEYKNSGPGAKINSERRQLTDEEASKYTISNVLKGEDNWDPENLIK